MFIYTLRISNLKHPASILAERSMTKHCAHMRNALIKLFEEPVPENYKAGRQVLHSIMGRNDIPIDKLVLCFATDQVLSAMAKPGVTPIVWETKARLATGGKTVLESMEGAGSECLMEFLGTFSYIPSTYFTVFVHTRTFKYRPVVGHIRTY